MVRWFNIKRLKFIDEKELFKLDYNNWDIKSKFIGNAQVVTVDNFLLNPDAVRDFCLEFPLTLSEKSMNYWPGARQNVKCNTENLGEAFQTIMRNSFKETKYLPPDLPEININILDSAFNGKFKNRGKKEYFHPHHDALPWQHPSRYRKLFASSIWLNPPEECNGGTSFWKNKYADAQSFLYRPAMGNLFEIMEGFPSFAKEVDHWRYKDSDPEKFETSKVAEDVKYHTWWPNETTEHWEYMGNSKMKFNRMVMYQGIFFHSLWVEKDWFTKFPRVSMQFFM